MIRHCIAWTRDGKSCRAWVIKGSAYCFWHHPARENDRKTASSKGGSVTNSDRGVPFWSDKHRNKSQFGVWSSRIKPEMAWQSPRIKPALRDNDRF
jgi:hypothetical protein